MVQSGMGGEQVWRAREPGSGLAGTDGDSIDNIPGAPGIGAKGAVQIVKQFGSIDNALQGWEQVKHKSYRESLRDNADLIRQSRDLATIRTDVNIDLDLDKIRSRPPDRGAAYQLFSELEFTALTREFADAAVTVEPLSTPRTYRIIRNRAELDTLISGLWESEHWAFAVADPLPAEDVERNKRPPSGVAISTAGGVSAYINLQDFAEGIEAAIEPLRAVLSNGLVSKSVHDLKRAIALL